MEIIGLVYIGSFLFIMFFGLLCAVCCDQCPCHQDFENKYSVLYQDTQQTV